MIVLGQYGVERWNAADDEYLIPPDPPQIRAVAEELPEILDSLDLAEARIEDKGRAIAVHTRSLPDPKAALATLADPLGDLAERHGLVLEPGKNVWEIRATGIDKGAALRAIVDETGARQVIFAGDDLCIYGLGRYGAGTACGAGLSCAQLQQRGCLTELCV